MKRIAVILLALLLLPAVQAQSYTLSGQVLDQDGQPVAGADVYLNQWRYDEKPQPVEPCDDTGDCAASEPAYQGHSAQTTTDGQGRYSFSAIAGWADVSVQKAGYAYAYQGIEVNGSTTLDLKMLKYPDKTAHVEGRITSGGQAVKYASISIENPEYGVYECSTRADAARDERTMDPASGSTSAGSDGAMETMIAPDYYNPDCAIVIQSDGSFAGDVTPGYSILRVYVDSWQDPDRVEYYSLSRVLTLPADGDTRIDLQLTQKPGPDARLKGYVIDATTQEAIPGAQVSFSNQDSWGWASAQADKDGSYRVALRSGMTQVSVWADGYFPWEGQVVLAPGDDRRFDILVTPGESRYGGYCCYAYAEDRAVMAEGDTAYAEGAAMAEGDTAGASSSSGMGAPSPGAVSQSGDGAESAGGSQSNAFEDLGGGLGPYDPSQAQSDDLDQGAPGFEIAFVLLALAAIVLVRRR